MQWDADGPELLRMSFKPPILLRLLYFSIGITVMLFVGYCSQLMHSPPKILIVKFKMLVSMAVKNSVMRHSVVIQQVKKLKGLK